MTTTPTERAFAYFERGALRDDMLMELRLGLRQRVNPETGALFTEDEVAQATQRGGRFYREASAIDIALMGGQSRAMFFADQVRMDRAADSWLYGFHGVLWGETPLPESAGGGAAEADAVPRTIFLGSTTPGDPGVATARDPAGLRYQVLTSVATPAGGTAPLTLFGISTGPDTNLAPGVQLTWETAPVGAAPTFLTTGQFTGGWVAETASDFSKRLRSRVRHKPASGNESHVRAWARGISTSALDAYIYSCAMHAGSSLVCITQKRGSTVGPLALVASDPLLAIVTAYIVPPGSPVMPSRPFLVVTTFTPQTTDSIVQLAQPRGNTAGWADLDPWPKYTSAAAAITAVTDQQHFRMSADTALPTGVTAPQLMAWNAASSRFVSLLVTSVTSVGGGLYDVVLGTAPAMTLAISVLISPNMARRGLLDQAVEQYFDGLGPGELVSDTDSRFDRAARFPDPTEEAPSRGGQSITTPILDALGGSLSNISMASMSSTTPGLPADVIVGPKKLTLGRFAVYDLT